MLFFLLLAFGVVSGCVCHAGLVFYWLVLCLGGLGFSFFLVGLGL